MKTLLQRSLIALAFAISMAAPNEAGASDEQPQTKAPPKTTRGPGIGVQGFGIVLLDWPVAKESFEAAGLDSRPIELGGGGRITNIWRTLFAQVSASRWSSAGERTFVDSTGARFPLGIPLEIKATYVDVTAGWTSAPAAGAANVRVLPYVGAGVGLVTYSEESPFAQPGDDLQTRSVSYHVLGGVEIPVLSWLGIAGDVRYRSVPDLLGEGGVSSALDEDSFGGFQTSIGISLGFRGRRPAAVKPVSVPRVEKPPDAQPTPEQLQRSDAVIIREAPAFLLPDARRTPLRVLAPGTVVRVLEQTGDWLRVEFNDPQFGPRIGYVQREFVQVRND